MLLSLITGSALAIQPKTWNHSTEADFEPGKVEQTVVTNLGDIKLASAAQTLDKLPDGITIVYDLLKVGRTRYLAAGPEGRLLKLEDETASELARPADSQIFTLARHNGSLLVGLSGQRARLARLATDHANPPGQANEAKQAQQTQQEANQAQAAQDADQGDQGGQAGQAEQAQGENDASNLETISTLPESAKYIWDILVTDNALFLATGPEGVIYRLPLTDDGQLTPEPAPRQAGPAKQDNDEPRNEPADTPASEQPERGSAHEKSQQKQADQAEQPQVGLPEGEQSNDADADQDAKIVVKVKDDGTIWVDGDEVPFSELTDTLNQRVTESHANLLVISDQGPKEKVTQVYERVNAIKAQSKEKPKVQLQVKNGQGHAQADQGDQANHGQGPADKADAAAKPDPRLTTVLDTAQANILCLGRDQQGRLYAGTDTAGLIYRITQRGDQGDHDRANAGGGGGRGAYKAFVLYDAAEPEIGAMVVRPDGTVYAGTADAEQARPGRLEAPTSEETGRPEPSDEPADAAAKGKGEGGGGGEAGGDNEGGGADGGIGGNDQPEAPGDGGGPEAPKNGQGQAVQAKAEHNQAGNAKQAEDQDQNPDSQADQGNAADDQEADQPENNAKAKDQAEGQAKGEAGAKSKDNQPAQPTDQQRDRLREMVRKRLEKARDSGEMGTVSPTQAGNQPRATRATAAPTGESEGGNAVYRITPRGFASELFRESVMILDLAVVQKKGEGLQLLAATGPQGQVFRIDPDAGETAVVSDLESEQIPAIRVSPDNPERITLGAANPAKLVTLQPGLAEQGTYTSKVLDSKHISLWGTLNLTANVPAGTSVKVETRAGNVSDPELAAWSQWSQAGQLKAEAGRSALRPEPIEISSPPARFMQYRLTLGAEPQAKAGPVVNQLKLAYVFPNQKPKIKALKAEYPETNGDKPPATQMKVEWEATDPNGDRLTYHLEYQPAGSEKWLTAAKELTETSHKWKTDRVPNGFYRLRLTADDRLDNPGDMAQTAARTSDAVLVDNSPPALDHAKELAPDKPLDQGKLTIHATATDELSTVSRIAYTLDDEESYTPILPEDLIYDSTTERFSVTIAELEPGPHVLTLKITDARGNTSRKAVVFSVAE